MPSSSSFQASFIFLVSFLTPAFSQSNPFDSRIIGGVNATRGQFPFLAFIEYYHDSAGYLGSCGGSLITPDLILTAAHCCNCANPSLYFNIYLNMYNADYLSRSPASPDVCTENHTDVTARSCHSGYQSSSRENDFCLIRLNRPSVYKPAVLYDSAKIKTKPDAYGKPVVIAGFGRFDEQPRVADNLLKAEITVANTTRCLEKYEAVSTQYRFDPALVMCGNVSTGKAPCIGDSGGPLFTKVGTDLVVIGVTAIPLLGANGCDINVDSIYGRVDTLSFRNFANPILNPPPSRAPSLEPTSKPTRRPTSQPTSKPTRVPSLAPSKKPTQKPTDRPTKVPSRAPTQRPTKIPSTAPTQKPTKSPTDRPTKFPTRTPTVPTLTRTPTEAPTRKPSKSPTEQPTKRPSGEPTVRPTRRPTQQPSVRPTKAPSSQRPTNQPSTKPSKVPTRVPTGRPSREPTFRPTTAPTSGRPTRAPTFTASCVDSSFP